MPLPGWNPALEALIARPDNVAQCIPEARVVTPGSADLRMRYDQWVPGGTGGGLDAIAGLVQLTNDGGVELIPSLNTNGEISDTAVPAGDPSGPNPPWRLAPGDTYAGNPYFYGLPNPSLATIGGAPGSVIAAMISWQDSPLDLQFTQLLAYLHPQPNPAALSVVQSWVLNIYAVTAFPNNPVEPGANFEPIRLLLLTPGGIRVVAAGAGAPSWVTFDLPPLAIDAGGFVGPAVGGAFSTNQAPYWLITITPLVDGLGTPAPNAGWGMDTAHGDTTPSIYGSQMFGIEMQWAPNPGQGTAFAWRPLANTIPNLQLLPAAYSAATVVFGGSGTGKLFQGQTPDGTTEFVLDAETPQNSSVTATITDGTNTATFVDGDLFNAWSTPGQPQLAVLSTGYQVSLTLTPSSGGGTSPVLTEVGMQKVASTICADCAEVVSVDWLVDPQTMVGSISELKLRLIHDGERDFHDVATELLAGAPIANLLIRLWIGHASLPKSLWMKKDDYFIDDVDPQAEQLTLLCVSALSLIRGALPALSAEVDSVPSADVSDGGWIAVGNSALYAAVADAITTAAWAPSTPYAVGQQVLDANNLVEQVVVAGESGGSAPTWSQDPGGVTIDGTAVWQNLGVNSGLIPNDNTYIKSPVSPANATYIADLSPVGPPGTNVVPLPLVRAYLCTIGTGASVRLQVAIYDASYGQVHLSTWNVVSGVVLQLPVQPMTTEEMAHVTDWETLKIHIIANDNGSGNQLAVTWARLAFPQLRQALQYAGVSPRYASRDLLTNQQPLDPRYLGADMSGYPGLDETLAANWIAAHDYAVGEYALDSSGLMQECIIAGISGGSAPAWAITVGAETTDGGVTWQVPNVRTAMLLTKTITAPDGGSTDLSQLKDELDALAYLAGGAWISEQGKVVFRPYYSFGPTPLGIDASGNVNYQHVAGEPPTIIPLEEIEPGTIGAPGFRYRVPLFAVPWGYTPQKNQFQGETLAIAYTALVNLAQGQIDAIKRINATIAQWVASVGIAGGVGGAAGISGRQVTDFGAGIMVWRFKTTYRRPQLRLGGIVSFETDRIALYDFLSGRKLSGLQWATGFLVGLHDEWGTDLSVWVPSYAAVASSAQASAAGTPSTGQPPSPPLHGKPLVYIKPLTGGQLQVNVVPDPTHTGMRVSLSTVSQPAAGTGTLIAVTPGVAPVPIVSGPYTDTETVYATVTPYVDAAGTIMAQPVYTQTTMSYRYRASVYQSSASLQSIPNATLTPVTFDTVNFDNGSLTDLGVNPTRITVPAGVSSGVWIVSGQVIYAANATGQREALIYKNGALLLNAENIALAATVAGSSVPVLLVDPEASPGDYYELVAWQNAGGALSLAAGGAVGSTLQAVHVW